MAILSQEGRNAAGRPCRIQLQVELPQGSDALLPQHLLSTGQTHLDHGSRAGDHGQTLRLEPQEGHQMAPDATSSAKDWVILDPNRLLPYQ